MVTPRPLALATLLACSLATGCSAPRGAQAPESKGAESPSDALDASVSSGDDEASLSGLDRAVAIFDEAERSLLATLDGVPTADDGDGPAAGLEEATPPKAGAPAGELRAGSRCDHSCRALDSMQRSAERLCDLTGRDDPRCSDVGERLERARERVESTCGGCG